MLFNSSNSIKSDRIRAHFVLTLILLYVLFTERIFLQLSSGGRGILPILELVIPVVAAVLLVFERNTQSLIVYRNNQFLQRFGFFILLTLLLPFLGVLFNDYPARTSLTSLAGFRAIAFVSFGCWIAQSSTYVRKLAKQYLFTAVVLEGTLASTQYLYSHGIVTGGLFEAQYRWDITTQYQYSEHYIITGRSIGSFINPNELGFWSTVGFWSSALLFNRWMAFIGCGASLCGLIFSQSRGSLFALTLSMIIWFGYTFFSQRKSLSQARHFAFMSAIILLLGISLGGLTFQDRISNSPILSRFGNGIKVFSSGASADANAQGRVMAWKLALHFFEKHPEGTWGEPQMRLGSFMDNDYIRILLQGSILYLLSFAVLLVSAFLCLNGSTDSGRLLAMISVVLSVNAMSANPLAYTASSIFWMICGFHYTQSLLKTSNSRFVVPQRVSWLNWSKQHHA